MVYLSTYGFVLIILLFIIALHNSFVSKKTNNNISEVFLPSNIIPFWLLKPYLHIL